MVIIGLQANCARPHWSDSVPKLLQGSISVGYKNIMCLFSTSWFWIYFFNYNTSSTKYSNNQGRHLKKILWSNNQFHQEIRLIFLLSPQRRNLKRFHKSEGRFIPNVSKNPQNNLYYFKASILTLFYQNIPLQKSKGSKYPPPSALHQWRPCKQ